MRDDASDVSDTVTRVLHSFLLMDHQTVLFMDAHSTSAVLWMYQHLDTLVSAALTDQPCSLHKSTHFRLVSHELASKGPSLCLAEKLYVRLNTSSAGSVDRIVWIVPRLIFEPIEVHTIVSLWLAVPVKFIFVVNRDVCEEQLLNTSCHEASCDAHRAVVGVDRGCALLFPQWRLMLLRAFGLTKSGLSLDDVVRVAVLPDAQSCPIDLNVMRLATCEPKRVIGGCSEAWVHQSRIVERDGGILATNRVVSDARVKKLPAVYAHHCQVASTINVLQAQNAKDGHTIRSFLRGPTRPTLPRAIQEVHSYYPIVASLSSPLQLEISATDVFVIEFMPEVFHEYDDCHRVFRSLEAHHSTQVIVALTHALSDVGKCFMSPTGTYESGRLEACVRHVLDCFGGAHRVCSWVVTDPFEQKPRLGFCLCTEPLVSMNSHQTANSLIAQVLELIRPFGWALVHQDNLRRWDSSHTFLPPMEHDAGGRCREAVDYALRRIETRRVTEGCHRRFSSSRVSATLPPPNTISPELWQAAEISPEDGLHLWKGAHVCLHTGEWATVRQFAPLATAPARVLASHAGVLLQRWQEKGRIHSWKPALPPYMDMMERHQWPVVEVDGSGKSILVLPSVISRHRIDFPQASLQRGNASRNPTAHEDTSQATTAEVLRLPLCLAHVEAPTPVFLSRVFLGGHLEQTNDCTERDALHCTRWRHLHTSRQSWILSDRVGGVLPSSLPPSCRRRIPLDMFYHYPKAVRCALACTTIARVVEPATDKSPR